MQIGEFATDYIEVRRDFDDWTPSSSASKLGRMSSADAGTEKMIGPSPEHYAAGDRHGHAEVGMHEHRLGGSQARLHDKQNGNGTDGLTGAPNGHVAAGDRHGQTEKGLHEYKPIDGHLGNKSKLSTVDENV